MTLLLDENLSHRLARAIDERFPGTMHIRDVGMRGATDHAIWDFAVERGMTIVSKDDDFHQRSLLEGPPPKVLWLRVGNVSTDHIADLLNEHH